MHFPTKFAVALGTFALLAFGTAVNAKQAPLSVTVDTSQTVNIDQWAQKAKALEIEWYPKIVKIIGAKELNPPPPVKLVFKAFDGVAYTAGNVTTVNVCWVEQHPDDIGLVVHELTHVVQAYDKPAPGWLVEGIADYVRWWCYEPASKRAHLDFTHASYKQGYQVTAAFLAWLVKDHPNIVKEANAACKAGTYNDDLFVQWAGKPLDQLWQDFVKANP